MNLLSNNLQPNNWVSGEMAMDLGTANTLIWVKSKGVIVNEPSIIARNINNGNVIAVGEEASAMVGKTHRDIETIFPLRDGVIADFEATDGMIQGFVKKINFSPIARFKMVICVPSGVTEVERKAVRDSAERANAKEIYLIDEPVAAAIGIGIDISKPVGNMIVDIGGGTSEIAVIALNGVVTKEAIKVAGREMDSDIVKWFRNEHKLEIGLPTSEKIKVEVGTAMRMEQSPIQVKGRDMVSGIPKTVEVSADEIRQALKESVTQIVDAIKRALENTPPELAVDILNRGIVLTGGGSMLKGLDQNIRERTNLPANMSERPLTDVVRGTGTVLMNIKKYTDVLM